MATTCVACGELHEVERCPNCGAPTAPGGYRVERLLAQTAHSRMFAAVAPDGGRVALKELVFALVPGADELDAFEREVKVLASLALAGVPRMLASFREGRGAGTRLYLVQEFVDGTSLAERLREGPLSETDAVDVGRRVLAILERLHTRLPPVVHRDLKPANLIARNDGEIFLVDFGSARALQSEVTYRSTLVGTYGYMPPEQLAGSVDPSADLYALGATLAHLVSGLPPSELMGPGLAIRIDRRVPGTAHFRSWLSKLVDAKRSRRFRSAAEALRALDLPEAPPLATPLANRIAATVTGLLVLLGVGALAVLQLRGDGPTAPAVMAEAKPAPAPKPAPPPRLPVVVTSAPKEELPPVEVVSLERIQPAGARTAFWLDTAFDVDARRRSRWDRYYGDEREPTKPCREAPAQHLIGYAVSLPVSLSDAGAMLQLRTTNDSSGDDCRSVAMHLYGEDGEELQRIEQWGGGTWIIPRNEPRFTLHLDTSGRGVDVGIDVEHRRMSLPR